MNKLFLLTGKVLFISLIIFGNINLFSQTISGKITDKKTGEAVPFSTISIEGTTLGQVSDFEGNFELSIPTGKRNGKLLISCVGYEGTHLNIAQNIGKKNIKIKLNAKFIEIEEVVVSEKSLYPYNLVKKAAAGIKKNFIIKSYNCEMYYKSVAKIRSKKTKQRELVVMQYDKTGYTRTNDYQTFKNIGYKFLQSKRNFKLKNTSDELVNLDAILEFDIARNDGNILDIERLNNFNIFIERETVYKGDSVWILNYTCKSPNWLNTGDFYVDSYSGKLYIKKENYAVLYNTTNIISKNQSEYGRYLYLDKETKEDKIKSTDYNFSVSYKLSKGKYVMDEIKYKIKKNYVKNVKNQLYESQEELKTKKIIVKKTKKIIGRKYYDNLAYNKNYWKK